MGKKWTIDPGPPRKVRLAMDREQEPEQTISRYPRVRAVGKRIIKMLVVLWVLTIGAWLQACNRTAQPTGADSQHDAIDHQGDPFGGM